MAYYRFAFLVLGVIFVAALAFFGGAMTWSGRQEDALARAEREARDTFDERVGVDREERARQGEIKPLRTFSARWEPHLHPAAARDLGNHLRNALATLATRTGLTSEGAVVPPEPRPYAVGEKTIPVQHVSLSVIGESLPAIITWLGAVESQFPYSRIESLTLSGYASRSVQLSLTLLHPVEEKAKAHAMAANHTAPLSP